MENIVSNERVASVSTEKFENVSGERLILKSNHGQGSGRRVRSISSERLMTYTVPVISIATNEGGKNCPLIKQ